MLDFTTKRKSVDYSSQYQNFSLLVCPFLDSMPTLSKQKIRIAQLLEHQTLAVHSLFYQGKRYSKMELEKILEAYYRRQNRQIK